MRADQEGEKETLLTQCLNMALNLASIVGWSILMAYRER